MLWWNVSWEWTVAEKFLTKSEAETTILYWDFYVLEIKAKEKNFPNIWFYQAQHKKQKMQETSISPLFQ